MLGEIYGSVIQLKRNRCWRDKSPSGSVHCIQNALGISHRVSGDLNLAVYFSAWLGYAINFARKPCLKSLSLPKSYLLR
jgi:hypothetical protein